MGTLPTTLEPGAIKKSTSMQQKTLYVKQGRYKRRLWNMNFKVNPSNCVLSDIPSTHTENLQTAKQFNQNEVFVGTESLEKQVEEALDSDLQVIPSDVLHCSLSFSAIVLTDNIVTDENNKQSRG